MGLAFSVVACINEANDAENVEDSVLEKIDSTGDARRDSIKEATDSLEKVVESSFDKTDSANQAIADSAKKRQ